jgi:dienelactone hydrolase
MRSMVWRGISACILLITMCVAAEAQADRGIRIEFDSMATGKKERVAGHLGLPAKAQATYPLMLIMHSSGGLHSREWFFARTLNEMGVATFVLDSFGPRGLVKVSENKRSFGEREMSIDALTALEVLSDNPSLDFKRLGAMGRSLGGQTAVRLTMQASRDQLPKKGPLFDLALSITPGCTSQQQDRTMTHGAQVWLFLAEKDAAPYQRCLTYVEKMRAAGGDSQFKVYQNALHAFDGSPKPVWWPKQEVYAECANDRVSPKLSIRLDTGAALRTRKDWDQFFSGCVKHGMWTGGNPDATRELDRDWTEVVRRRWLQ